MAKRIAVLVSGGGTNLQALIDAQARGEIVNGEIAPSSPPTLTPTPWSGPRRRTSPPTWWPGSPTPPARP